jgi:hypothetical protein
MAMICVVLVTGAGGHRVGLDRGFGFSRSSRMNWITGNLLAYWVLIACLQSRTIFRQPGSPKAVR